MLALLCATAQAQINPKVQQLIDQLGQLEKTSRIIKSGGQSDSQRLLYSASVYYSPNMYLSDDKHRQDSLLQHEKEMLKRQVATIRRTLDQLQEDAQESYHYEFHQGGNDTIIYSMNLCGDSARTDRYRQAGHTYFFSDEYISFDYHPHNVEGSYIGQFSYMVRLSDADSSQKYTTTELVDDVARLFRQHRIKPRQAFWRHDKDYSDSIWHENGNEFVSMMSYGIYTKEGETDATIYTVPREQPQLATQLLAAIDSMALRFTDCEQDMFFQYYYNVSIYDPLFEPILYCHDVKDAVRGSFALSICCDDMGFHFVVTRTRGTQWVPRNWPCIKSFVNGETTYFKGMKPKPNNTFTKIVTAIDSKEVK